MTKSFVFLLIVAVLISVDIVHDFTVEGEGTFLRGYLLGGAVVAILWFVASLRTKETTNIQLIVKGNGNTVVSTEIERVKTNA